MSRACGSDELLIARIRSGEQDAWSELIARFEGRLLAFVEGRLGRRNAGEDVVQETFLGFLNSLPNFDDSRPLETYLFSIAAHKLTDHLRREGRRPTLPLSAGNTSDADWELPDRARPVSSLVRSGERRAHEDIALIAVLREQVERMRERGDWQKLKCIELILVRNMPNKEIAVEVGASEQTVANYKFDFLARLRTLVRKQGLSADLFPELYESEP
jgi:RNA polymerase sigma-70 factor (ECF subfamily)